jgi:hypothetical protein
MAHGVGLEPTGGLSTRRINSALRLPFRHPCIKLVAGTAFESVAQGYEPRELPILYPAIMVQHNRIELLSKHWQCLILPLN